MTVHDYEWRDMTSLVTKPFSLVDVAKASLIFVTIIASAFLIWQVRDAVLLVFAAAITALMLRFFANTLAKWTHLPPMLGVAVAILVIAGAGGAVCWLFGTHVASEFSSVLKHARGGWDVLSHRLQNTPFAGLGQKIEQSSTPMIGSSVRTGFTSLTSAIEALIVLVVSSIYLALEPRVYRIGVIRMFKPNQQEWAGESIDTLGKTMKSWLLGQLLTMLIVGILSFIAMWALGVPGAGARGLIAGIAEAVPYVGPFLGAIPAVLVASTKGLDVSLYTAGAYLIIHLIEGYFLAPLIQRYFVSIPPALMLFGIIIAELIFGTPGILLAAPLTVTVFLVVKMFYLRDTLHQRTDIPEADGFGSEEGAMIAAENGN